MASVTSLDQDMRNLRLSRYTPQAANEARSWIEETLGHSLPPGDLLDTLKDGVALCQLVNLVMPSPGVKYKSSQMPFIQMENISHFLRACELPPLSMPAHDRFLTVDLYEGKDPAQVLQCLSAFSRQAHAVKPSVVRTTIGPKKAGASAMSPSGTGTAGTNGSANWTQPAPSYARSPSPTKFSSALPSSNRPLTPSLTGGSTGFRPTESGASGPVSSWSKRADEGTTAPAWNIHQYGYMGGASQGNQGISFGARRQITSQAPAVPSLAEKERIRKEKAAAEEARLREAEKEEQIRQRQLQEDEERAKLDEERRWEEETQRQREEERKGIEEQKRQWAEQERRWKEEEELRRKENADIQVLQKKPPEKPRVPSSSILRGQTLSEYQREQASLSKSTDSATETPEQKRVRELEKQLEEARERERQYQAEREERLRQADERSRPTTAQSSGRQSEQSWTADERDYLRQASQRASNGVATSVPMQQAAIPETTTTNPVSTREPPQTVLSERPKPLTEELPVTSPQHTLASTAIQPSPEPAPVTSQQYQSPPMTPPSENRTDRFLSGNPAPAPFAPRISSSQEAGDTSLEQSRDRDTRLASQQKTRAGGWASKSLLEREMERERERQREWEANQAELKDKPRDANEGIGEGQTWDVNQYGYMGGDGMNRGSSAGSGINFGGRRQILGPREMGSKPGSGRT